MAIAAPVLPAETKRRTPRRPARARRRPAATSRACGGAPATGVSRHADHLGGVADRRRRASWAPRRAISRSMAALSPTRTDGGAELADRGHRALDHHGGAEVASHGVDRDLHRSGGSLRQLRAFDGDDSRGPCSSRSAGRRDAAA